MRPPTDNTWRLHTICPYFTRFPLRFPYERLRRAHAGQWVLDPFCGSGATVFAARLHGLGAVGVDSNPVAAVIARAKCCRLTARTVTAHAADILADTRPVETPTGPFWEAAYAPEVLRALCRFRAHFCAGLKTPADVVLAALLMGVLHGPKHSVIHCCSNHMPADFAPCPHRIMADWSRSGARPPHCDVYAMIARRAAYLLAAQPARTPGAVYENDSRSGCFASHRIRFDWIITSPPYYGLDSFVADQWLRHWLIGGPAQPDKNAVRQIAQDTPEQYVADLATVWQHVATACRPGARLLVRVGNLPGMDAPPAVELLKHSLRQAASGWKIHTCRTTKPPRRSRQPRTQFAAPAPWPENETELYAQLMP